MASLPRATLLARAARARPVAGRRIFNNRIVRRNYATEGDHGSSGSDLPWALGAVAVTIPSLYFMMPSGDSGHGDGHGHGHEEPKKEEEGGKEDAPAEEESPKKEEKKEEPPKEEKKEESSSEGDSGDKRTQYEKYDGKPKGGRENTSSKEGPEHTGARHASSPHSDESKSKKGEGTVETARVKGTIDPNRKQV